MDLHLGQIKDVVLGQDFLTWLWFKSEKTNGQFRTAEGVDFACHVEQRISVQGGEGDNVETATVSGALSELREARLGLTTGKKVNKMQLRMERDTEVWQGAIKAEDFTLTGLRTPKMEAARDDDEPDAAFYEKVFLIERFLSFIDALYAQFLTLRLGPEWAGEERQVREWVRAREQ